MFLKLDGTFIVQLFNFAIFFAILNVVFIRPVSRAIVQRREYINSVTNDYDRYQAEATSLRTEAEAIRAAARRAAEGTLARSRADASNESAGITAQYGAKTTEIVEEAHRTVAGEMEIARRDRAQLVSELAGMMVDRIVTESA